MAGAREGHQCGILTHGTWVRRVGSALEVEPYHGVVWECFHNFFRIFGAKYSRVELNIPPPPPLYTASS